MDFMTLKPRRIPRAPTSLRSLNLALGILWILLFLHFQAVSYYDPSSFFFRKEEAYKPLYSAIREQEADAYIASLEDGPSPTRLASFPPASAAVLEPAPFCLGIPSLERPSTQFLSRALASLVDSLDPLDRAALHIVVLLADDDPASNSAFGQPWLHAIADTILIRQDNSTLREDSSANAHAHAHAHAHDPKYRAIERLPPDTDRLRHLQMDDAALMRACLALGAQYFLLVEDDTIAARDWFARLTAVLPGINAASSPSTALTPPASSSSSSSPSSFSSSSSSSSPPSSSSFSSSEPPLVKEAEAQTPDWLYLRLFYSETYLGWNSEEWPSYLCAISVLYLLCLASLSAVAALPQAPAARHAARLFAAYALLLWLPLFTLLYFMAGRLTVQPLRRGVREMPAYGCCAQGLLLPAAHVDTVRAAFEENTYRVPVDSTIEAIADERRLRKLALVPSVMQHAGVRGSSGDGGALKLTWNFSFERAHSR